MLRTPVVLALAGAVTVLVTGCSSLERPEVEDVAAAFEDPAGDPEARCDLLAPATRAALEDEKSQPCPMAVQEVLLLGGAVRAVEVWGRDAQVVLAGDTLFLTETRTGWRVTAAACEPRGDAPYDCEVEGP